MAYTLSRGQLPDSKNVHIELKTINTLEAGPTMSMRLKTLREETQKDTTLAVLQICIREGWLAVKSGVETNS